MRAKCSARSADSRRSGLVRDGEPTALAPRAASSKIRSLRSTMRRAQTAHRSSPGAKTHGKIAGPITNMRAGGRISIAAGMASRARPFEDSTDRILVHLLGSLTDPVRDHPFRSLTDRDHGHLIESSIAMGHAHGTTFGRFSAMTSVGSARTASKGREIAQGRIEVTATPADRPGETRSANRAIGTETFPHRVLMSEIAAANNPHSTGQLRFAVVATIIAGRPAISGGRSDGLRTGGTHGPTSGKTSIVNEVVPSAVATRRGTIG